MFIINAVHTIITGNCFKSSDESSNTERVRVYVKILIFTYNNNNLIDFICNI